MKHGYFLESMIDDSDFATKIMGIGFETVENDRNPFLIDFWLTNGRN